MPIQKPILQSCCCWRSLKLGSYLTALYTLGYYGITAIMMIKFVMEEREFLSGNVSKPKSESFLEQSTISETTVTFNIVFLACSLVGVLSTVTMVVGLCKNQRFMLMPWIINMTFTVIMEFIYYGYMIYLQTIKFNPITAIMFTLDFFLVVLHMYATLCVISQYQVYMMMRSNAADDLAVIYSARSQLSDGAGRSDGYTGDSHTVTIVSHPILTKPAIKSSNSQNIKKKKVQFPDEVPIEEAEVKSLNP